MRILRLSKEVAKEFKHGNGAGDAIDFLVHHAPYRIGSSRDEAHFAGLRDRTETRTNRDLSPITLYVDEILRARTVPL